MATNQILKIHFKQPEHLRQHAVLIDNVLLEETESTKFLGMHLDKGLTSGDHIDTNIYAKVVSGIFTLLNLGRFCNLDVMKMA